MTPSTPPAGPLVGYRRVSTKEQLDGFGLDVQGDILVSFDANLVAVLTDEGESGSNGVETRVALHEALGMIASGSAAGLLVPRLDRLARDLIVQEQLIAEVRRLGGQVFSCAGGEDAFLRDDPSDPSRRLIRQILGSVSEYERAMVRLRLEAGRARKRAGGGYAGHGSPPFGWRAVEGELVRVETEQATITRARELSASGKALAEVATALNAEGHTSKRGGLLHPEQVRRILKRT